ncbi:MAG: hypothetical protein K2P88_14830 [Chitinophagaceae bacterium]|uniref:hypothetical protein n=1 Tax=unclassified Paraflavitalea TaxID=2798305 RepID=UPI003D356CDF|nr:hypothetical protein [Chitinophagaceae bacterium]
MKNSFAIYALLCCTTLVLSCTKNSAHYYLAPDEVEPSLDASIYPVVTTPSKVSIGAENTVVNLGETVTFFVPYKVVGDDVQTATLTLKNNLTGEVLQEAPMTLYNDLSILNVTVPEEIQGTQFFFVSVTLDNPYAGRTVALSTEVVANRGRSKDELVHAFSVQ